ncbi:hypothetical protein K461DRAFT_67753 [Myriangium duriaei CBS 260.36]|uniref:Uncharacterized protein n=1 Tax=Myriangium duriaei CBS 260.36 TaxID=1168546 RepID=A0A9P4IQW8_9PEZI|nr:hypothetical protein K461DRAFT_67753 [Myriangium duriaei CBS 260.36]
MIGRQKAPIRHDIPSLRQVLGTLESTSSIPNSSTHPNAQLQASRARLVPSSDNQEEIVEESDHISKYSTSTSFSDKENWIEDIVELLIVRLKIADEAAMHQIAVSFEELLKSFSVLLGYEVKAPIALRAAFFLRSHRERIAQAFTDRWEDLEIQRRARGSLPMHVKVKDWLEEVESDLRWRAGTALELHDAKTIRNAGSQDPSISDDEDDDDDDDEDDNVIEADMKPPRKSSLHIDDIKNFASFSWFISRLKNAASMRSVNSSIFAKLTKNILDHLKEARRVSKRIGVMTCVVFLDMDWDVNHFLKRQRYSEPLVGGIRSALTVTGSVDYAYASTVEDYISLIWPHSVGDMTIDIVNELSISNLTDKQQDDHFGGYRISAALWEGRTLFRIQGNAEIVTDICVQLAWLGSALQFRDSVGLYSCQPEINWSQSLDYRHIFRKMDSVNGFCNGVYWPQQIHLSFRVEVTRHDQIPGTCWRPLFHKPVLACGFPIPSKDRKDALGLEIPLEIMASLFGTDRLSEYNEKPVLKGFASVLVPSATSQGVVSWHLLVNEDNTYFPYTDSRLDDWRSSSPDDINTRDLVDAIHVVGWCAEAELHDLKTLGISLKLQVVTSFEHHRVWIELALVAACT